MNGTTVLLNVHMNRTDMGGGGGVGVTHRVVHVDS